METIQSAARRVGRNWGWMLAYGILLIIMGFFAMMHPLATGLAIGLILAISFFVSGVGSFIAAFRDAGWSLKLLDVLFGLVAVAAGVICIANPFAGATTLVWVIGIMFIVMGVFELVGAFQAQDDRLWLILLGVLDLVIGYWAAFRMGPGDALLALAGLVGIAFLFRGVLMSILAFRVKGLANI